MAEVKVGVETAVSSDIRQQANSALIEVDKGLRSNVVGEQCEAIVKCPLLMDKFPFPVMTSTALLKLADIFSAQSTANLLRLHILQVFQLSQKHLGKVSSPDELVRRLYLVCHSNDPIARALTLRVFGSIAIIVAEKKNVHHSIHHGLDSHHQAEVEAAIFATSCLAKHSATFAAGVCEKISSTVQGLAVPVEMKLSLIPILSQMHHNLSTATQVRELCVKLLPSYPAFSLVISTLHTLTILALATKIHIPDQIWLLLSYSVSDARSKVRVFSLQELQLLATAAPHMWTTNIVTAVADIVDEAVSEIEKEIGLKVLFKLSKSLAVHYMSSLTDTLDILIYSRTTNNAALALATLTNIKMAATNGVSSSSHVTELTGQVIEALLTGEFSSSSNSLGLNCLLQSMVKLCSVCGSSSHTAVDTLLSLLPHISVEQSGYVCHSMVSIAGSAGKLWAELAPVLTAYLSNHPEQLSQLLLPFTAVLQELHRGEWSSTQRLSFQSTILPCLLEHVWSSSVSLWLAYRVARKSSVKGFHELAQPIYHRLSEIVTVARFRHWLNALHLFSSSQLHLSHSTPSQLITALSNSSAIVSKAAMLIKASNPTSSFPLSYLTNIASLFKAHHQLLTCCVSTSLLSHAPTSLTQKFQFCVSRFQSLVQDLSLLYSSLFDADPITLSHVSLLRQSCLLMINIMTSLVLSRKPLISPGRVNTPVSTTAITPPPSLSEFTSDEVLGRVCQCVMDYTQPLIPLLQSQPVGEEHVRVLAECSHKLLRVPQKLPPYFFTSLQHTSVQLAFSPPLPSPGQSVHVSLNSHLSLKVEGIIQHSAKNIHRKPQAVCVRVNAILDKQSSSEHKGELPGLKRVEPVTNDYFLAPFLISFPHGGSYTLHTTASLMDQKGVEWETGPQVTMSVLVDTEQNLKQDRQGEK